MEKRGSQCLFYFEDQKTNRKKLFEEALNSAKLGKVLYILREELTEIPQLSQDLSSISLHYMKMISFLYTKSIETLIDSLSSLPNWQNIPNVIILEELSEYCDKSKLQNACGITAFLIDTVRSCANALNKPCKLIISASQDIVGEEYCETLKTLYSNF